MKDSLKKLLTDDTDKGMDDTELRTVGFCFEPQNYVFPSSKEKKVFRSFCVIHVSNCAICEDPRRSPYLCFPECENSPEWFY